MTGSTLVRVLCIGVIATALPVSMAEAETAQSVRLMGRASNRVDVAVLGDGYTSADLAQYRADVDRWVGAFFREEPFRIYAAYFNVHRVDVISAESGADHPASGVFKDTALGSFYDCAGIARLICVDYGRVYDVLERSLEPDKRDVVIVLVNDSEYGGSGGPMAVASLHPDVIEVMWHEIGHTLGLLADEYEYGPPDCFIWDEPATANITTETTRARIKWRKWIAPETPVPTYFIGDGVPGLYEGGDYCWTGKYRPTFDSKMRSLFRPFEAINVEQLTKRIYAYVSPIDAAGRRPPRGRSRVLRFYVTTLAPADHRLRIRWELDGQFLSDAAEVQLTPGRLRKTEHTLRLIVSDPTTNVRNDPERVLRETRTWRVSGAKP